MGQAAGHQGGDRLHRAVQRVRLLRRSRRPASDLRPARPRHDPGVLRTVDLAAAAAAFGRRPRRRVLVGPDHAAGGDLSHHRAGRPPPRPVLLRGPGGRHLDLGRPESVEIIFKRDPRGRKATGTFKTAINRHTEGVTINVVYKHSRAKQYLKDGRALRIETVINDAYDLGCQRLLPNLDDLQAKSRAINQRLLDTERVGQGTVLASPAFARIAQPTVTDDGRRAPALRFGDPRVQALAGALANMLFAVTGITNKRLRALMAGLLGM